MSRKESVSIIILNKINCSEVPILTESNCSLKIEHWKFTFSNKLHDIYNLIREEGDNNCMFRALSRTTFGSPEYHSSIRVQVVNYIETNKSHFEDFIDGDFNQYMSLIRETYYWRGNEELVAFSELYWVNIEVYDRITLYHPRYVIEFGIHHPKIWLFYSEDHYNSLIPYKFV